MFLSWFSLILPELQYMFVGQSLCLKKTLPGVPFTLCVFTILKLPSSPRKPRQVPTSRVTRVIFGPLLLSRCTLPSHYSSVVFPYSTNEPRHSPFGPTDNPQKSPGSVPLNTVGRSAELCVVPVVYQDSTVTSPPVPLYPTVLGPLTTLSVTLSTGTSVRPTPPVPPTVPFTLVLTRYCIPVLF